VFLISVILSSQSAFVFNAAVKSSWSSSTSTESYGNDPKLTQQEQMKSHRDEQAEDTAAAAAAANSNSQFEGMAKDARKQFGKVEHATWLPGWNLSSLTQLTGAVTNTVNCFFEVH